jgi:Tol biopolymer transport system component
LLAHPFDAQKAEFAGEPQVLLGGAKVNFFSVSESGVLAWVPQRTGDAARSRMTWLDRNGKTLETFSELPKRAGSPRLSPDGNYFVFNAASKDLDDITTLFVYDLTRASFSRIVSVVSLIGNWSPDGKEIAYVGARDVWITDAAGTKPPRRPSAQEPDDDVVGVPSDWSPDGRYLAYFRLAGGNHDVWILPTGTGEAFAYDDGPGDQHFASFSPDGKWLAYTSDDSGRREVYVDSFPTRGTRIQVSTNGGTLARWRRDGSELYFVSGNERSENERSEPVEFYAVDVDKTEDGLSVSRPNKLFEVRARFWNQFYDVTADGQRFLMPIRPDLSSLPIHIEADWRRSLAN